MAPPHGVEVAAEVGQGFVGRERHGDGRFEFVGDVVGEVAGRGFELAAQHQQADEPNPRTQQQHEKQPDRPHLLQHQRHHAFPPQHIGTKVVVVKVEGVGRCQARMGR